MTQYSTRKMIAVSALVVATNAAIMATFFHHPSAPPDKLQTLAIAPSKQMPSFPAATKKSIPWQKTVVQNGDSLAKIFQRLNISQADLLQLVKQHKEVAMLHPRRVLYFQTNSQHRLEGMKYPIDQSKTLILQRDHNNFIGKIYHKPETTTLSFKSGTIHHSLYRTAEQVGLTHTMLKQLQTIFGGSINFARDIHAGDRFAFLYQEFYIDGKKVRTGDIVAAEFTSRGTTHRAVRYTYPISHTGYYTPDGHAVEARFLRAPLRYKRISSRFSYHRLDPVLHLVHSHLGIDYAARPNTPIKSIGDGKIIFIGSDGGYGKTIKIRYGKHYRGLYAHMRRFAKNIKLHQYVRKGQIIGYVGETGWATGPHLHFGFYINGIAHNWLAMKVPRGKSIPHSYQVRFIAASKKLLAELHLYQETQFAANSIHDHVP